MKTNTNMHLHSLIPDVDVLELHLQKSGLTQNDFNLDARTFKNARRGGKTSHSTFQEFSDKINGVYEKNDQPLITWEDLVCGFPATSAATGFSGMGVQECYFGKGDNDRRNNDKKRALSEACGEIVILAQTGQAYLASDGALYNSLVQALKDDSAKKITAVILSPFSTAAIQVYINWIRSFEARGNNVLDPHSIAELLKHKKKLKSSMESYEVLQQHFRERVDLRLTSYDIQATILWTDKSFFIEPYFQFDLDRRMDIKLDTFELKLNSGTKLDEYMRPSQDDNYQVTHIDFYKKHSLSYENSEKHFKAMRNFVEIQLELLVETNELPLNYAECIRKYLDGYWCKHDSSA